MRVASRHRSFDLAAPTRAVSTSCRCTNILMGDALRLKQQTGLFVAHLTVSGSFENYGFLIS